MASRRHVIAIAGGVVVVLGVGFWLGRSPSHDVASAEPAVVEKAETRAAIAPIVKHAPAAPAMPRRAEPAPGLLQDLGAADPKIRRAAVDEIIKSSDPDPKLLLAASKDSNLDVSFAATNGLAKLYADGQVPVAEMMARAIDHSSNLRVRSASLNAFGAVPSPEAAELLVRLVTGGDELERRTAAALLGNQDLELAVPALIRALGDSDEYVRGNALESLRRRSRGRDFGIDAGAWQAWWQSRSR